MLFRGTADVSQRLWSALWFHANWTPEQPIHTRQFKYKSTRRSRWVWDLVIQPALPVQHSGHLSVRASQWDGAAASWKFRTSPLQHTETNVYLEADRTAQEHIPVQTSQASLLGFHLRVFILQCLLNIPERLFRQFPHKKMDNANMNLM
jgi:hypothetical protein